MKTNFLFVLVISINIDHCSTDYVNDKFKAGGPFHYPRATVDQWEQFKLYSIVYICVTTFDGCGSGSLIEGKNNIWWVLTAAHHFKDSFEVALEPELCHFNNPVYRIYTPASVTFNIRTPPTNNLAPVNLTNQMNFMIVQYITINDLVNDGYGSYRPTNDIDHLVIPYEYLRDTNIAKQNNSTKIERDRARLFDIALIKLGTIEEIRAATGKNHITLFSGTLTEPQTGGPRISENLTVFGYGARDQNFNSTNSEFNYLGGSSTFKIRNMIDCLLEGKITVSSRRFTHFFCYRDAQNYGTSKPGITSGPGDSGAPIFCEDHKVCGVHLSATPVARKLNGPWWPDVDRLPDSFGIRVDEFCNWIYQKIGGPQTNFGCH